MKKSHIFLIFIVLGLDQATKMIVNNNMSLYEQIQIIPGFFNFTYLHNTGAAWSMFEGKMMFFYLITIVALVGMFLFYRHSEKGDYLSRIALSLMMAGTLGNFIDRILFQHVRDFIDFIVFGYDFPVFNIADMALFFGVVIIFLDVFMESYGMVRKK